MEMIGYAVKDGFIDYLDKHHHFVDQLFELPKEQLDCILDIPDEKELCERAVQFFHNEAIYLDDHTVYYENKLKQTTYAMQFDAYKIHFTPQESNPFIPFLQRIYRNFVLMIKKDAM